MLELLDLRARRERLEPRRLEIDPHVSDTVRGIVRRVRDEGDDALLDLAMRFDGADLRERGLVVSPDEFAAALDAIPDELRRAIDALVDRVADLHRRQLPSEWRDERDGVRFGERVRPVRAAGCYVPGGRAVYPSSVAMTVTPAAVAGVEEIVVCTPPRSDGSIHPEVLYAARVAGATRVVKSGGAQAIAALAFGTASVPAVDVVVGPGNAYVTEAKRQLAGTIGIDGLAGPTELVLVADGSADPLLDRARPDRAGRARPRRDRDARAPRRRGRWRDRGRARARDHEGGPARGGRRGAAARARRPRRGRRARRRDRGRPRPGAPPGRDARGARVRRRGAERRRDLRRRRDGGAVRRLWRRLEPRAADGRNGAILERPSRHGLPEGDVGRGALPRRRGRPRARRLGTRAQRGSDRSRPGRRGPSRRARAGRSGRTGRGARRARRRAAAARLG